MDVDSENINEDENMSMVGTGSSAGNVTSFEVISFLRKNGFSVKSSQNGNIIIESIGMNSLWGMRADLGTAGPFTTIRLFSSCNLRCPRNSMLQQLNLMLTKFNTQMVVGNFEIDYRDGEVRFKTSLPTEGLGPNRTSLSKIGQMFGEMLRRHISAMSEYGPQVVKMLLTDGLSTTISNDIRSIRSVLQMTVPEEDKEKQREKDKEKDKDREKDRAKEKDNKDKDKEKEKEEKEDEIKDTPKVPFNNGIQVSNITGLPNNVQPEFSQISVPKKVKLGASGFSKLYKGTLNGQDVVVKEFHTTMVPEFEKCFCEEVQRMCEISSHPNVSPVLGVCEPASIIYPFSSKLTLQHVITKECGKLKWADKMQILLDVANGLNHLHNSQIAHGNLHPGNIVISESYKAQITHYSLQNIKSLMSIAGSSNGSTFFFGFQAPEVASSGIAQVPADIYSFGVLMWYLATERTPYSNYKLPNQVIGLQQTTLHPDLELLKDTPESYDRLIEGCWAVKPKDRRGMSHILSKLEAINISKFWERS
eukprot:TRINITY_DN5227_c0_g1_i3.p1 TRINITY_DN5227_c0_g1~~TRINITY_DN5227_c0_g1_i3.p1  ORF type:complete len:533 (-),score=109.32 TRINITY_DN5227_c0_g1_i3:61-1659(-)